MSAFVTVVWACRYVLLVVAIIATVTVAVVARLERRREVTYMSLPSDFEEEE